MTISSTASRMLPRTPLERALAALWCELLGVPVPGVEDDFFACGGDSILAAGLLARACRQLEVEVPLSEFVAEPTIAALARAVEAAHVAGTQGTRSIGAASKSTGPVRCSDAQERFWFIDQATGSNVVSNVCWALRLGGSLDVESLARALAALVERHESLRTRFDLVHGQPVQVVAPAGTIPLRVIDVADEAQATELAAAEAAIPFDLGTGPLLRAQLLRLAPVDHVLQFVAHHIVCDDWSKRVIMSELGALYAAFVAGEAADLPAPEVQYPAYARWRRDRLGDELLAEELGHWRHRLAGAPPALELPSDRPRPRTPSMRGARLRTTVPPALAAALRDLGRTEGATFFMTMLAALQVLLHRYTGQDDLVVGTAVDNRGRIELEGAIGLFTNVLALRADVSGQPSFRELLGRARTCTLDAVAHQELPFERLVAVAPERDASRHPIFQVFYEFIVPAPLVLPLPGIHTESFEVPKRTSEFDLGLYLDEQRGGLDAVWEYSTDLFERGTIERMARHFIALLGGLVAEPDRPVAELPLLDDTERSRAIVDWNATAAPAPEACVDQLFELHAGQTPGASALVADGTELSYGELNARANRIAHLLRERGVGAGAVVGLCLERTPDLIAAMLGILKAGAVYLPLHPDHPPARLAAALRTAQARTLIGEFELPGFDGDLVSLDRSHGRLAELPDTDPRRLTTPDDTAYILYTSGSTGVPKGVAVTHRNLVNYAAHMVRALGGERATAGMQFGSVSAVSTDLGNTAIFPALAGGGCLHLIATEVATDAEQFAQYLARGPLDVLKITPSHLGSLLDTGADVPALLPRGWLILGGEALTWELAERVHVAGGPRIMNHYGPTETTVGCCTYELLLEGVRPPAATVPIGRPISNATVYVLDPSMAPVPVGVPGELYVGGAGVARGYVSQPELTAQAFIRDPFSGQAQARLYRTGDLARYLPDGAVEFLGRADEQVKIRGYRVEPAEVQAVLVREHGVRQAAVIAVGEGEGKRLVAYVVPAVDELDGDDLRNALERALPAYMVPSQIAMLEAVPLTPNGKLDRAALPSLDAATVQPGEAETKPLTELESALAVIWAELLGHEVGVDESFFETGGHSLLAIRLIARIRSELGVKLTLKALVDAPTIREFAARVQDVPPAVKSVEQSPASPAPARALPRAPRGGPLRCSFAQEQFWLVDQLTPGSSAYNFSWPMQLEGRLSEDALRRAVEELVQRHEALRTRFTATDGQPMQIVERSGAAALEVVDLTAEPNAAAAATRLVDEHTQASFDLEQGPLLRVLLLRLGEAQHILQIVVHHIVFDGVSKIVLYRELGDLYEAFANGRESPLSGPALQYGDYAEWQRSQLDPDRLEVELEHWRSQLVGMPAALELPTDGPRPAVASMRGARIRRPVPRPLREALEALARNEGATFFTALLAAFDVLLYRYTGQEDLVVGTPVDTRSLPELEHVVGPFINTVVIRNDLSGSPSFRGLLRGTHRRVLDAVEHQELPFERLVEALAPERDLSRHPLFQALLALNPSETGLALAGIEVRDLEPAWSAARVELFLILDDLPQGMEAIWEYSTDLFDPATIDRMAQQFLTLLERIVADPDRPIDEIELLDGGERAMLIDDWNRTETEVPDRRLEELVAEQARATPDRIAVEFEGRALTYGELDRRANQLAHRLQALGGGPNELVGICLARTEELLVALLGTMKAGAAYVPIDPTFPPARQQFMLDDAQVRVLVTEQELLGALPTGQAHVLCLDRDRDVIALESTAPPLPGTDAGGLAYVIYTSGSTGEPKGVEIEHRALVNFLTSMLACPGLSADDVLLAVTTLSFDISGLELYLPLVAGARVVIASATAVADPRALVRLLEASAATAMQATPTTWRMLVDSGWEGRPGMKALCGGEALPPSLADELIARDLDLWNMYGPTETTIWSTCAQLPGRDESVTVGRPIANTTLYVLDRHRRPTPIGVPGELYIGGLGLARAYRNRAELTAERFVADPFGTRSDGRLYKTGDLARYRRDGTVTLLGRLDDQVKLRGHRIELGEVEAALAGHPGIRAAAAAVHRGRRDEPALIAYVVAVDEPIEPEELQRFLARSLPRYMIPASIVTLSELPLTPNGKLDRGALPAPAEPSAASAAERVAPRTETEELVASLFADVLGIARPGAQDDFFALGGQSLLAARLISRLDARFEIELPLRALFEAPTVAGIAARVDSLRGAAGAIERPAVPSRRGPPPLLPSARTRQASFAQERFWFIDQVAGGSAAYNISWALRVRGALDVVALERALNDIVRRHEVLRTRFAEEDGRPVQVVEPPRSVALVFADLSGETEREADARRIVDEQTREPFVLSEGPLLRATLTRLSETEHILQVVVHHIAADGWSRAIFFRELDALYAAYRANRPSALPEPPVQYGDFAQWQRSLLEDERLARELSYWTGRLEGMPSALELPTDRPRPDVASVRGGWLRMSVPAGTLAALDTLAREERATLFMVMLAAFDVLLYRYTGQEDVVVGTPVDTRGRPELEQVIGPFVNTLAIRSDLSGSPSFRELLGRVRLWTLDAIEHQELPFEQLVESLAPQRALSRHPLFQTLMALSPPEPAVQLGGLEVEELDSDKTSSRVDLALLLQQRRGGLDAVWEYSSDLFDPETVAQLGRHFLRLLESIVSEPERAIDELALLEEPERSALLATFDEHARSYPVYCLHERFEAQAELTPDAVALCYEGLSLSYRELNERANRLAHRLLALGAAPDVRIALCLERSLELVVAILAVLKAGSAYVPLDPEYPLERIRLVLEDCGAAVLVTQESLLGRLPTAGTTVVCVDQESVEAESAANPAAAGRPDNLAYVIYTSGSTGRPKGVLVEHRNVARLFTATEEWFGPGAADTWTLLHSFAFDFSVWEMWGALLYGGRLVIVPTWTARSPDRLAALVSRDGVTVLNVTPSLFTATMPELLKLAPQRSLRLVIFGGEALHPPLLRPWFERFGEGGPQLVNMYGITETTVHVTYRPLTVHDAEQEGSPIGRPIPDLQLYLLDSKLSPVPAGVTGELFVGGAGVARGYLNRPELTEERFLSNPFGPGHLYRTGDQARWGRHEGLVFLGRIDDQVKVRGFRIELGEVRAALADDVRVVQCAVLADTVAPGDTRLAAYVVPSATGTDTVALRASLREGLQRRLPAYMVPSSLTMLDALPLTANGKIDRRALPAPSHDRADADPAPPRTEVERELAELWRQLLGVEQVGIHDDFFELGGHSLLAAQLAARIRARFGRGYSVRAVFEDPTIARQGLRLGTEDPLAPAPVIRRRRQGERWPLSHSQQQLWLIDQLDPGAPTYNVALAFRARGPLELDALRGALTGVLVRHEALRTVIRVEEDRPVPVLLADPRVELATFDLAGGSESEAVRLATELARRPFDFAHDPLLRASAIRISAEDHILLLETHHIAFDGVSERILLDELAELYCGRTLPEPPLQFGDHALWERSWLADDAVEGELAWWRTQLAGARTSIELPVDRHRPDGHRFRGASHELALTSELAAAARTLCREERATPYMLTLAALATVLYRVTGQDDILVGSPVANRPAPELESVIGFFSNTLVFRVRLGGNPTFRELLGRVRETALDVYAHQSVPFEKIVEAIGPDRSPGVNPLFQVNLRVSTSPRPTLELPRLAISQLKLDSGLARFDLALDLDVLDEQMSGYFRYNRDLFEPETVARLAGEFLDTLRTALDSPDRHLLSFEVRSEWSTGPIATGLRDYRASARGAAAPPTA